jgi:hypothetical protein
MLVQEPSSETPKVLAGLLTALRGKACPKVDATPCTAAARAQLTIMPKHCIFGV